MNLSVNLILPDEQRSASPIRLKLIVRLMVTTCVLALGLYFALNLIRIRVLHGQLDIAESRWNDLQPRRADSLKLIQEATENVAILDELRGWRDSRIAVHETLLSLAQLVPAQIQLTGLNIQHDFQLMKAQPSVGRSYAMSLSGRLAAQAAEVHVQAFEAAIKRSAAFSPLLQDVNVPKFGEGPKDKTERVFQITCTFKPRSF